MDILFTSMRGWMYSTIYTSCRNSLGKYTQWTFQCQPYTLPPIQLQCYTTFGSCISLSAYQWWSWLCWVVSAYQILQYTDLSQKPDCQATSLWGPLFFPLFLFWLFAFTALSLFPRSISDVIFQTVLMSPAPLCYKLRIKSRFNVGSLVPWCWPFSHPKGEWRRVQTIYAVGSSL